MRSKLVLPAQIYGKQKRKVLTSFLFIHQPTTQAEHTAAQGRNGDGQPEASCWLPRAGSDPWQGEGSSQQVPGAPPMAESTSGHPRSRSCSDTLTSLQASTGAPHTALVVVRGRNHAPQSMRQLFLWCWESIMQASHPPSVFGTELCFKLMQQKGQIKEESLTGQKNPLLFLAQMLKWQYGQDWSFQGNGFISLWIHSFLARLNNVLEHAIEHAL